MTVLGETVGVLLTLLSLGSGMECDLAFSTDFDRVAAGQWTVSNSYCMAGVSGRRAVDAVVGLECRFLSFALFLISFFIFEIFLRLVPVCETDLQLDVSGCKFYLCNIEISVIRTAGCVHFCIRSVVCFNYFELDHVDLKLHGGCEWYAMTSSILYHSMVDVHRFCKSITSRAHNSKGYRLDRRLTLIDTRPL